jgi:hypothetical protein
MQTQPHDGPFTATVPPWRRALAVLGGACLVVLSAAGLVHGTRAAVAQALYHQAKFGSANRYLAGILRRCEAAGRLYPWNYYFCSWAAGQAYARRDDVNGAQRAARMRAAERWCDAGLSLNPYRSQLRLLKTRLLQAYDLAHAIRHWEAYVDWAFWYPHHHAVLAELYASAGDVEKAAGELRWVRGTRYEARVRRAVREALAREREAAMRLIPR